MNKGNTVIVTPADRIPKKPVAAGSGTSMQVLIGSDSAPNFAMRRFIMEPGGGMPNHTNSIEHEQFVLRGHAKVGIGKDVYKVKSGDVVFIPKGIPHWYKAEGDEPFEFICVVPNIPDHIEILEKSESQQLNRKVYIKKRSSMLSLPRRILKKFHPEGIPFPGTFFYNFVSKSKIFQHHYDLISQDVLNHVTSGKVLDIGTGPGWLLLSLHKQNLHFELVGADISASMVERAKANIQQADLSGQIHVEIADAKSMPFADDSFDAVISTGSVHHWKYPLTSINEIYRILKPGGYAFLYDIVSDIPKAVLKQIAKDFGRLRMFLLWLHAFEEPFYSLDNYRLLAGQTRFKEGTTRFVGVMCCLSLRKSLPNVKLSGIWEDRKF